MERMFGTNEIIGKDQTGNRVTGSQYTAIVQFVFVVKAIVDR